MNRKIRAFAAVVVASFLSAVASVEASSAADTSDSFLGCGYCSEFCEPYELSMLKCVSYQCGLGDDWGECEPEHPGCSGGEIFIRCTPLNIE